MSFSVNTNVGALVALQNLNATSAELQQVQGRINTGLKVASAKDNGAIWAIAQSQRAQSASLDAVKDSLQRGQSIVDVALAAGGTVSDLLIQMKAKALAASDTSLDTASRNALNEDFKSLRDQITTVVSNADFNGSNLLNGGANLSALANADGTSVITVAAQDMSVGSSAGSIMTVLSTSTIGTVTAASAMIATVATSIDNVSAAL
ncbi:MAG TPA: flagellin, partial [Caulobacteraceae bacterium]|nr:flagellin [Caulobacteraceae bacterium]